MAYLNVETSLTGRRWVGPDPEVERQTEALAQITRLPPQLCAVLARNKVSAEGVSDFLAPSLRTLLPDPMLLRDMDKALPGALVVLSIWADLETSGDSLTTLIDSDLDFGNLAVLYDCGHAYAGDNDLSLPLISPVNAALHDLPPMLIQVGAREMLLSDSLRLASNARDAGVPVDLDVWDGMGHMFQAIPSLPEAIRAHFRIGAFLENLG